MKTLDKHLGFFDGRKLCAGSFIAEVKGYAIGTPLEFTVCKSKAKRSSPQNRYYFGVIVNMIHRGLKDGGMDMSREGTHELLRFRFLAVDTPIGEDGEFISTIRSTTELDKEEFGIYIDQCKQFAAEYLNLVIPEPNEQMQLAA